MITRFSLPLILLLGFILLSSCGEQVSATKKQEKSTDDKAPATCIETVIAADEKLGSIRNHACEKISLAQTISEYVKALDAVDFTDCPKAFTKTFGLHINAWRAMIPLAEKYPDKRGEMHDLFDELEKGADAETFKPLLKDIWDTWALVEEAMKAAE